MKEKHPAHVRYGLEVLVEYTTGLVEVIVPDQEDEKSAETVVQFMMLLDAALDTCEEHGTPEPLNRAQRRNAQRIARNKQKARARK